uniref:Uncharacterized protein n=1 Tax=Arundo donax TaxID=35708 RepID=A0A0A9FX93_ARUDO
MMKILSLVSPNRYLPRISHLDPS